MGFFRHISGIAVLMLIITPSLVFSQSFKDRLKDLSNKADEVLHGSEADPAIDSEEKAASGEQAQSAGKAGDSIIEANANFSVQTPSHRPATASQIEAGKTTHKKIREAVANLLPSYLLACDDRLFFMRNSGTFYQMLKHPSIDRVEDMFMIRNIEVIDEKNYLHWSFMAVYDVSGGGESNPGAWMLRNSEELSTADRMNLPSGLEASANEISILNQAWTRFIASPGGWNAWSDTDASTPWDSGVGLPFRIHVIDGDVYFAAGSRTGGYDQFSDMLTADELLSDDLDNSAFPIPINAWSDPDAGRHKTSNGAALIEPGSEPSSYCERLTSF